MKRTKILTAILFALIFLPLGCQEIKADPFPNVFWYYLDTLNLNENIEWNNSRIFDNRYWTIQPINDRLDVYFLLNITIMSNTTIDVFLFGDGGASNEIDIPEGTKTGTQFFSFEYLLKNSRKDGTSSVYLYIDNSDDDGRGIPYIGDALVNVTVIAEKTLLPIAFRYLLIFIPIVILSIVAVIIYNVVRPRKKLTEEK